MRKGECIVVADLHNALVFVYLQHTLRQGQYDDNLSKGTKGNHCNDLTCHDVRSHCRSTVTFCKVPVNLKGCM